MEADLKSTYEKKNIILAWLRLKSNPDRNYKNYFRPLYTAYASAEEPYLKSLCKRLKDNCFEPSLPTKIYIPKSSGILRPITLLSVEDQILYQAFGNKIALKLSRRIRHMYYKKIFGNIFTNAGSNWFYKDWRIAYNRYNYVLRDSFNKGYKYAADFDLTACYDSIDHFVLKYYLNWLGFSQEFIDAFLYYLCAWTCVNDDKSKEKIFHGHGIPQGPLTSGLISDVVLHVFDTNKRLPKEVDYFRYVDDIKLFAQNEKSLRKALISLDYTSKMVGLFPQTSKIGIHKIKDIEQELKTISNPPEPSFTNNNVNQDKIHTRINELTKNYIINEETRFKYTLSSAMPRSKQSKRLLRILDKYPHLYMSILSYFGRYNILPKSLNQDMYNLLINENPPYFSFQAKILDETYGKYISEYDKKILDFCIKKWKEILNYKVADDYIDVLLKWVISKGKLSYPQILELLEKQTNCWLRSRLLFYISEPQYGEPSYEVLLNRMIRQSDNDVAIVATYLIMYSKLKVLSRKKEVNHIASVGLREFGLIKTVNMPASQIPKCINEIVSSKVDDFDWKQAFKKSHKDIESQFLIIRTYYRTDPTAFFMAFVVALDSILNCLAKHDNTIGSYQLGCIGSYIYSNTSRFAIKYPEFYVLCRKANDKRKHADLSHPINRNTGLATRRLKFKDINSAKGIIKVGINEFISKW